MKLGVMVLDGPYQHQAADSALAFIRAARARGHEMVGVFLFADGVGNAQKYINPPGERNISQAFEEVAAAGIPVVACTACAKFRGLKPDLRTEHIQLSGLGSLVEFVRKADRFVTFGD
jgi:tRNA 2-thiouridine synthesizing protein D